MNTFTRKLVALMAITSAVTGIGLIASSTAVQAWSKADASVTVEVDCDGYNVQYWSKYSPANWDPATPATGTWSDSVTSSSGTATVSWPGDPYAGPFSYTWSAQKPSDCPPPEQCPDGYEDSELGCVPIFNPSVTVQASIDCDAKLTGSVTASAGSPAANSFYLNAFVNVTLSTGTELFENSLSLPVSQAFSANNLPDGSYKVTATVDFATQYLIDFEPVVVTADVIVADDCVPPTTTPTTTPPTTPPTTTPTTTPPTTTPVTTVPASTTSPTTSTVVVTTPPVPTTQPPSGTIPIAVNTGFDLPMPDHDGNNHTSLGVTLLLLAFGLGMMLIIDVQRRKPRVLGHR